MTATEVGTNSGQVVNPRLLTWHLDRRDPWRTWTLLALAGLVFAAVMAAVGLPPIDLHPPWHFAGVMDPFCGGTRAIRLAAQGQWERSWAYNPLGIPLLVLFVVMLGRAGVGFATHRWYSITIGWTRRRAWITVAVASVLLVLLDIRQQSIASLLMTR